MESKKKRSIVLLIRRFFATFLFFSTVMGIISDIETDVPIDETLGGALVSFFIIYLLARSPRRKVKQEPEDDNKQSKVDTNYEDTENIEILVPEEIQTDNEGIELENYETQIENVDDEDDIKTVNPDTISGYNPVKDNEGIFSRLFKGRNNRYG